MEIMPPFDTPLGRVGLSICFDVSLVAQIPPSDGEELIILHATLQLRFPEISLALKRQNAQIVTYPSAFTVPTGQAHWETLLRARAIETQAYVVAAAQAGPHNEKRRSYGHSMIVNPWGEIVAKLGDEYREPAIATAEIDLNLLQKVRREMPLIRRTDIYPEV
jgi:predicted amidohydrolase